MEEEEATTALVPFWENKVQYYCYVVPSFNGKNPKATIAKSLIQEFFDTYLWAWTEWGVREDALHLHALAKDICLYVSL